MNSNNSPDGLRQAVHDALLRIAQDTGEHPITVMMEALTTSVVTLTALDDGQHVDRVYQLARKGGHTLRQELNRQNRAEQATMQA